MDVDNLQNDGLLKIEYSKDWYLSFNQKNNTMNQNKVTIDNESINRKFFNLVDQVTKNEGKKHPLEESKIAPPLRWTFPLFQGPRQRNPFV